MSIYSGIMSGVNGVQHDILLRHVLPIEMRMIHVKVQEKKEDLYRSFELYEIENGWSGH